MPHFSDRYGLELTTSSPAAADAFAEAMDHALAGNARAEECFAQAAALDEGFALAHIGLARMLQFRGAAAAAREGAARAKALVSGATRREQQHVETVAAAIDGGPQRALALLHEHIADFPRDALVLNMAVGVYGLIGFSGRTERNNEQLALLAPLEDAYGDDWWFLASHAFALNELFQFEPARQKTERSLELYSRNGHASHAMAHVEFETGDPQSGARFLEQWLPGYGEQDSLYGHLWWHLALFHLTSGDIEAAISTYDRVLAPAVCPSVALGLIADGASLLWRVDLARGNGPDPRWAEVADFAARAFPAPGITFADMHCALAYAATRDQGRLGRLIDALRERVEAGRVPAGEMVIPLAKGMEAFAAGDYERAIEQLEPIAGEIIRIGGSHAQRELFEDTLLEAYLRAGARGAGEGVAGGAPRPAAEPARPPGAGANRPGPRFGGAFRIAASQIHPGRLL
jgi:tetratricopeptide (TPR) repeat protein